MPARRLPWFKFWPEAMRHEKVVLLSDSAFRTWVATLAAASEQATRWRFASVKHLVSVTARPEADVREMIGAHLLDISSDGNVWIHDWRQWQERYASDFTPRTHRNGSANVPPSLPGEERGESKSKSKTGERIPPKPPANSASRSGGLPPTPRKRGARNGGGRAAPAAPEVATPLTAADRELWAAVRGDAATTMNAANAAQLAQLEPVGRSADGALLLRAPLGQRLERFRGTLMRSLADAGDAAGPNVVIFEG